MLTKKQLDRFCAIRNASAFNSNLQFGIDAEEAGFKITDLGGCEKVGEGHYQWDVPLANDQRAILTERNGKLSWMSSDVLAPRDYFPATATNDPA